MGRSISSVMWRRIALIAGLVAIGIASTLAGYAIFYQHRNPVVAITQMFVPSPLQTFGKPNLLVLVEGLDYDYTAQDIEYSTSSRSDALWAVNLDFVNKRIFQLSIPRDMVATMPNGAQAKINNAQSEGGVNEAKKVVAQWLGIGGFDRYVILRIDATKEFVNTLGGIDLYVKSSDCLRYKTNCTGETLDYDDTWGHLHIHLKEGLQHLNGEQTMAYMRFRHDWCSDPCRIMRQQQVLHAMSAKLRASQFNTLMNLPALLAVFRKYVQTDFTNAELLSIATYYQGVGDSAIVSAQVPYTGDVDLPAYGDSLVPDTGARAHLVATMLVAPPAPQPSPNAVALAAIAPQTLRVDVENGSGVEGAAHQVAAKLRKAGFEIGEVGDAPRSDYTTTEIHEHSPVAFAGAKVRAALGARTTSVIADPSPIGSPDAVPTATSDVTVIVGNDLARSSSSSGPSN
jgi:polyisoprenyl-teichoic acid--peptidoglycan teichoic acid transferase